MADPEHHVARIVASLGFVPQFQLLGQIGGRLARECRVGGANALSLIAVTRGAGTQAARAIAFVIELQPRRGHGGARNKRQAGVIAGHGLALIGAKLFRYPSHLRMVTATIGIGPKLSFQISGVQSRQPRRAGTVATPVETVTGEAGVACPGPGAAHRDDAAVLRKPVKRRGFGSGAASKQRHGSEWQENAHDWSTFQSARLFRLAAFAPLLLPIAACQPPPDDRQFMPVASAANGREVITRVGCGSCHIIPGVYWPMGKVGPGLAGLADRALIAGKLPNRPDVLAAYIRNAPSLVPGSGMPAMPVTEAQAHDIAAYLYQQEDR